MPEDAALIQPANYEEHLDQLKDCDLVIEAIAERMDWKLDLYKKIAPHVAPHAIVASNTSGLSITKLSEALPDEIKPRFCGIHFFNPPRYMALVELIPTPTTQPEILDQLETFVTTALGKSVVRAKDTPNFIANRVGIAGMLATMNEAEKFGLDVRRGRRPHRQEARPRQLGHVPHRRRGGPRHDGARGQDACRTTCRPIRSTRTYATPQVLAGADRAGRARPEDRRGLLQEGRQGHPAPRPGQGRLRAGGRQGRPDRRAHAEEAGRPSA